MKTEESNAIVYQYHAHEYPQWLSNIFPTDVQRVLKDYDMAICKSDVEDYFIIIFHNKQLHTAFMLKYE